MKNNNSQEEVKPAAPAKKPRPSRAKAVVEGAEKKPIKKAVEKKTTPKAPRATKKVETPKKRPAPVVQAASSDLGAKPETLEARIADAQERLKLPQESVVEFLAEEIREVGPKAVVEQPPGESPEDRSARHVRHQAKQSWEQYRRSTKKARHYARRHARSVIPITLV